MRSGSSILTSVTNYWSDLTALVRLNGAMLKAEASATVRGVIVVAVLGALAFASVTMLTVFLSASAFFWLLTLGQTPLMAALTISGVFLFLSVTLASIAMARAKKIEAFPHRTAEQASKDWQAFKSSLSGSAHVGK